MATLVILVIAYLLGSISCAILVCKLAGLPDPRSQGSGNPGASNVLRLAGKQYAAYTLIGDALKGFIPVIIATVFGLNGLILGLVAFAAVLGHMYPLFFKFQGGKGVATALGCYFALSFPLGLIAVAVWAGVAYAFKYASLASLVAIAVTTILSLFLVHDHGCILGLLLIAAAIAYQHRENIQRLRQGTEATLSFDQ